ncbi:MAG: LamG-like jellyroll fold domain-containing protein, partial [Synechococcus sp.]|nr:LamG-like jellyroll fold domain-containing protein [Synechococcus sp.]
MFGQITLLYGQWRLDGIHPDLIPNNDVLLSEFSKSGPHESLTTSITGAILRNVGNSTSSSAVGSDASGNIYVLGSYSGTSTIQGAQLPGYGGLDFVVFKFNPEGDRIWQISGCGSGDDHAYATIDRSGNTYLSGFSSSSCTISGMNGTSYVTNRAGGGDGFLVKIGPDGQIIWGVSLAGGSVYDAFNSIFVDDSGNVFAAADFNGCCGSSGSATVFFPGGSRVLGAIGYRTGALLKFDSAGSLQWNVRIGNRDVSIVNSVTDGENNVYFTGGQRAWSSGTAGSMVDGTGASSSIPNAGIGNSFLVKLDANGKRLYGLAVGNLGSGSDASTWIADLKIDSLNTLNLIGNYFGGEMVFNSTESPVLKLPASSTVTGFIAEYSTDGSPIRVSNLTMAGASNTWPQRLAWFRGQRYVAGAYRAASSVSGNYGFLSKLNAEFALTETKTIIGSGSENVIGMSANGRRLFASGSYGANSSFNGTNLADSGSYLWLADSVEVQQADSIQLDRGLLAYYPFDGDAENAIESGLTTIMNTALPSLDRFGRFNSAYNFNGLDHRIQVSGISGSFNEGTISVWMNLSSESNLATNPQLIGFYNPSHIVQIEIHPDYRIYYNAPEEYVTEPASVDSGVWTHMVLVVRRGVQILYLNGRLLTSGQSSDLGDISGSILAIGHEYPNQSHFKGSIDDIRIYNRALSEAEVAALYELESTPPPLAADEIQDIDG